MVGVLNVVGGDNWGSSLHSFILKLKVSTSSAHILDIGHKIDTHMVSQESQVFTNNLMVRLHHSKSNGNWSLRSKSILNRRTISLNMKVFADVDFMRLCSIIL